MIYDLAIKACIAGGAIAIAVGAWRWREHVVYRRGVSDTVAIAARAASAAEAANAATGQARQESAAKAELRHLERMKPVEIQDAKDRDARAADQLLIARLRATAAAGGRAPAVDAADACSAEHRRGDERIDGLLAEGQRLAIEGAGVVAEARGLVAEGAGGLARSASLIELARDWGKAVKLGEAKPP